MYIHTTAEPCDNMCIPINNNIFDKKVTEQQRKFHAPKTSERQDIKQTNKTDHDIQKKSNSSKKIDSASQWSRCVNAIWNCVWSKWRCNCRNGWNLVRSHARSKRNETIAEHTHKMIEETLNLFAKWFILECEEFFRFRNCHYRKARALDNNGSGAGSFCKI